MSNDSHIWDVLKKSGLTDYAAAGLMGNMMGESGLKPYNLQDTFNISLHMTDEQYTNAVNNGSYSKDKFIHDSAGYGLVQWTFWSLKKEMYEFVVEKKHKSIDDLDAQLDCLIYELNNGFKSLFNSLNKASSVREASNLFLFQFENPNDKSQRQQDTRCRYAEAFYNKFAGGVTPIPEKKQADLIQTALKRSNEVRGTYTTICDLNLRYGADPDKFDSMVVMPKGTKVMCYGYYNLYENTKWLCVVARVGSKSFTGYCSSKYLK